ncbi:hypothetical protein F9C28_07210 [Shimwellia pseudoproteus]|uniref:hypothetical protein n=1 Tax=Shimwellia pseudoproteus TaxID=570012 RepID=UPI0018ED7F01|nr:hypothetical protein [Shimwellia pseudoproteus]MBJ3814717.1 hypothetical protein [Shimwellia pseudoproteus]
MKGFIHGLTVIDFCFLAAETGVMGDGFIVDIIQDGYLHAEPVTITTACETPGPDDAPTAGPRRDPR